MRKELLRTKQLAEILGFTAIAANIKRNTTNEEMVGYVALMCNYLLSHPNCDDEKAKKITDCLRMLVFTLDFMGIARKDDFNLSLAA